MMDFMLYRPIMKEIPHWISSEIRPFNMDLEMYGFSYPDFFRILGIDFSNIISNADRPLYILRLSRSQLIRNQIIIYGISIKNSLSYNLISKYIIIILIGSRD